MARHEHPKLHKIGRAQWRVLRAVGLHSPAFTRQYLDELYSRWGLDMGAFTAEAPEWAEVIHRGRDMQLDDYLDNLARAQHGNIELQRAHAISERRPDIPWAKLFGGASRSQEAAYSRAVRKLEERGLVLRIRRGTAQSRTSHLRITPTGVTALMQQTRAELARFEEAFEAFAAGKPPPREGNEDIYQAWELALRRALADRRARQQDHPGLTTV